MLKPGSPDSSKVGMSGAMRARRRAVRPSAVNRLSRICGMAGTLSLKTIWTSPAIAAVRLGTAAVRDVRDRNPGLLIEGRERQMRRRAVSGRGGIELAGLALGEFDQILDGLDRQLRIGCQNQRVL